MGRVGLPFGVRGWLRIQTFSHELDGLAHYPVWWLGQSGDYRPHPLLEWQIQGGALVVLLEGVTDRSGAERLRGSEVAVPRDALPVLPQGEYYWSDLVGMAVVGAEKVPLGQVSGLLETGGHPVLVVQDEGQERLIPFVEPILQDVDRMARCITVDWGADFG